MTESSASPAGPPAAAASVRPNSPTDDPERGWVDRWRSWRDAFPGLLLFDAIRPASWLTLLLLGSVAFWGCQLASIGLERIAGKTTRQSEPSASDLAAEASPDQASPVWNSPLLSGDRLADAATDTFLSPAFVAAAFPARGLPKSLPWRQPRRESLWWSLLHRLVHLLIWAIPAGLALRYSLLSATKRRRSGLAATLRLAATRIPALLAVALIPLIAVGLAILFFLLTGWIASRSGLGVAIAEVLNLVAFPFALAAGLLAFGSLFAVPLGWAAVMAEPDGDAFDAISRGFEYTFRRPFHLVGYLLLGTLIGRVLLIFADGICTASILLTARTVRVVQGAEGEPMGIALLHRFVSELPDVFAALLFWTLVGGIYLLMRRAANGQEVEEIGGAA